MKELPSVKTDLERFVHASREQKADGEIQFDHRAKINEMSRLYHFIKNNIQGHLKDRERVEEEVNAEDKEVAVAKGRHGCKHKEYYCGCVLADEHERAADLAAQLGLDPEREFARLEEEFAKKRASTSRIGKA
jgi:hypothetical protein